MGEAAGLSKSRDDMAIPYHHIHIQIQEAATPNQPHMGNLFSSGQDTTPISLIRSISYPSINPSVISLLHWGFLSWADTCPAAHNLACTGVWILEPSTPSLGPLSSFYSLNSSSPWTYLLQPGWNRQACSFANICVTWRCPHPNTSSTVVETLSVFCPLCFPRLRTVWQ